MFDEDSFCLPLASFSLCQYNKERKFIPSRANGNTTVERRKKLFTDEEINSLPVTILVYVEHEKNKCSRGRHVLISVLFDGFSYGAL